MSHFNVHLAQAEHNRDVAEFLLDPPGRHDWAITAAFYAAIHYFEALLYSESEIHSETVVPTDEKGELRNTIHGWRQRLAHERLSRDSFKSFQQLRNASETARYLTLGGSAAPSDWTKVPAADHIPPAEARSLVRKHLESVRTEVRPDYLCFLQDLCLEEKKRIIGAVVKRKLMRSFKSRDDLLASSRRNLQTVLGKDELTLLEAVLREKGISLH